MSTERKLAVGYGLGRIAYAVAVLAAPRAAAGPWLGAGLDHGGGRVAARGLVARDAVLAAGVIVSAVRGAPVRPWLLACAASDASDIAVTLLDVGDLPKQAGPGVVVVAGAAGASGAALANAIDD